MMNELNKFIKDQLARRKQLYLSDPTYILEHYNNEQQNIEAYNGRQLLEMLQNADDAAETAVNKRVLIKLEDDELIIANNGESFTIDGFRSILFISVSPKTKRKNKIGHKGLGFRSILSWADAVSIHSGDTKVSFSSAHAREFLQELVDEKAEIQDFLSERTEAKSPIATLRVPKLIESEEADRMGYDTLISIKLKTAVLADVQKQIEHLVNKETLVFLNNTEQIEINSPVKNVIYTKSKAGIDSVTVACRHLQSGDEESKTWQVIRDAGQHKNKNYELAIAWNSELNDKENVLYSYFKTEVKFPFPALVHGTFELSPDRNHLERDTAGHNEFLTGRLADLAIRAALTIATEKVSYLPLKLLNIDFSNVDHVLQEYGFKEKLIEKTKQSKVFPNVNGAYISYTEEPVYYDYPIARLLGGMDVQDLMPPCDDASVVDFLKSLTTFHYIFDRYTEIVSIRVNQLSANDLASLIYHLLTYETYVAEIERSDFDMSRIHPILIDTDGGLIERKANVFVQPADGLDLTLPKFLDIKFLHPDLFLNLKKLFSNIGSDKLMQKLARIGIKEYSFSRISETVVEHYKQKTELTPTEVVQMHAHLFKLYRRESKENEPARFRISDTPVLAFKGKIDSASNIYFGKDYNSELTEALYSFNRNKLLARPTAYKFTSQNIEVLVKYFTWLGIARFPRYRYMIRTWNSSSPYIEHVLRNLKYPYTNQGWTFKNYNEYYNWIPSTITVKVAVFDGIDKIVERAKVSTIMEWIDKDTRLKETLEKNKETGSESCLSFYRYADRKIERHDMPSYTKWNISNIACLPIENNNTKAAPGRCCLSRTITEEFSPFVEKPKIPIHTIANKLKLPETTIENYLVLIGVHKEISSFSLAALYEVLNSLPVADKTGKAARRVYREIINNFNEARIDEHHPEYKKFLSTGKMLGRKGNTIDYYPVSESFYLPTKAYGSNVLKKFALAEIDGKQGTHRIEKLFGVKRLKDINFSIDGNPVLSSFSNEFLDDIERFKALVYVLRKDKDTNHDIAGRLKRLKIYLVIGLEPTFTYRGTSEKFTLEEFEYINTRKRSEFYISVPHNLNSLAELRESNKFCQSISEIFSTLIESEEYNDFIHDLYSKNISGRELRLLSYIQKDDRRDLDEAKRLLNIVDDIRFSFWRAFYYAKNLKGSLEEKSGIGLDDLLVRKLKLPVDQIERISKEVLEESNELENLRAIYTLFLKHNIDFAVFSRHYFALDFYSLFKNEIEDLKIENRQKFAFALFDSMKGKDIANKVKFFEHVDRYNRLSYTRETGFIKDCERYFIDYIKSNFQLDMTDADQALNVEEIISSSLAELKVLQVTVPYQLKENKAFQSLLLFGELDEIKRRIEVFQNSSKGPTGNNTGNNVKLGNRNFEYKSFEDLADQLLNNFDFSKVKIKAGKTIAISDESGNQNRRSSSSGTRNVRFDKSLEELIGFVSEFTCYQALVEKYGQENVSWISENANRAYPDRLSTKEAGEGYDLELQENGKTRYVEIKGTGNIAKGIQMSSGEMRVALEFQDRYDLMIVENPLGGSPVIRHIRSPFKFKKNETLFNNRKVKVFNDNYILKFSWDES